MEYKEYDSKMTSILEKIGNDSANLILDDVAVLLTDNKNMNDMISSKDKEIESLKSLNSRLQQVNVNLLQQIPVQKEDKKEKEEESVSRYNIYEAFDDNGKFKR